MATCLFGIMFRVCEITTRAVRSLFTVDALHASVRAWNDDFSACTARIWCLPCVFNDGCTAYHWFNKILPTYTENIIYWRYLRSCFLNKLWWRAGWCQVQIFDVCLCPSRCFCSVVSPLFRPPRPPVCVCVCMWFVVFVPIKQNVEVSRMSEEALQTVPAHQWGAAPPTFLPLHLTPTLTLFLLIHCNTPPTHTHTPLAVRRTILAADIVLRHDGNMADCSVVSFNPDYESIVCDLDWVSCTICCFLLFYFEEPMESWWRRSALLSAVQHLVVGMSVQISDCMWSVSLNRLVRWTELNQSCLECLIVLSLSCCEFAFITLRRKEKCVFHQFQILHTEILSWLNVFGMSDTVRWRSCRHRLALFIHFLHFFDNVKDIWIILFWQELIRYSCFSCF